MDDSRLGHSPEGSAPPAPAPSSSAAAMSAAPLSLPELPRFKGPANELLGAARWATPLLVLGGYYSLAIHGMVSAAALLFGAVVGGALTLSAHITLLARRRRLLVVARGVVEYAERTVGEGHELHQRARAAVEQLERDPPASCDPTLATDAEQGIGYTRELLLGLRHGREAEARRAPRRAWSV